MLPLLSWLLCLVPTYAWNQWDYKVTWSEDPDKIGSLSAQWHAVWPDSNYTGDSSPPRPRRGHSLHVIKTDPRSDYGGDTYVVLFGGRDNDQRTVHIPKTYDVETVSPDAVVAVYNTHM